MKEMQESEIYEKIREKVFFYVTYQKRTEAEVRKTFLPLFKKYNISNEVCDSLIEELNEKGYVDDKDFVKRKFNTYMNLKTASLKEIEYKLLQKGISKDLVTSYLEENAERVYEYELSAAKRLYEKKINGKSEEDAKNYLRRKGFLEDVINGL